jgi:formylglycine-generating enzyme required for sulfatase activity
LTTNCRATGSGWSRTALATRLVTCGEFAEVHGGRRLPAARVLALRRVGRGATPMAGARLSTGPAKAAIGAFLRCAVSSRWSGWRSAPVSHVSYFEADAYARWAGPAAGYRVRVGGRCRRAASGRETCWIRECCCRLRRAAQARVRPEAPGLSQQFGDCWEWTASAYLGYPGFKPLAGSLGEYNGKFMSGQMVLRGGSCVTPAAHIRASYRNFFAPETRWQFSGIRLASQ